MGDLQRFHINPDLIQVYQTDATFYFIALLLYFYQSLSSHSDFSECARMKSKKINQYFDLW